MSESVGQVAPTTMVPRRITRIALFAALFYVLSWGAAWLPNVNLGFLVAFSAGYLWGGWSGMLVGGIGMGLWTAFNPSGPASLPVMFAQIAGMAACGLLGAGFRKLIQPLRPPTAGRTLQLALAGLVCTLAFHAPVSIADAVVYGPFWPRLIGGLPFAGISLAVNVIVFPLLFGVTHLLYVRESGRKPRLGKPEDQ